MAVGLVLIAIGSGGVKANATSLVGSLYAEGDTRRDAGFSIFYLGINLGALVGTLLTGLLQKNAGFHYGFGLAAVGMFLGLVQYARGRSALPEETHHVPNPLDPSRRAAYAALGLGVVAVVAGLVMAGFITAARLADIMVALILVATIAYFAVILSSRAISDVERSRVWSFVPMFAVNAVFWSLFQQQFTVVAVYSDQRLNRDLFGWEMPVSWVQSINPVFIIALAGVFAAMWTRLGPRQPTTPVKFGLGTIVMGAAFLPFLLMPQGENQAPLLALVGILLLFTVAELLISPVGLSLSTKLAPAKFHTQMVALYFLSVALGTAMAGKLAGYYDPDHETGYFLFVALGAITVGLVVLAFSRPIKQLMAGVH